MVAAEETEEGEVVSDNYMPGSMHGAGLDDDFDELVTCNDCHGSGTCSECAGWGDGINGVCDWCDCTTVCPTCHGEGRCLREDLL